jgi:hypothetical protein
MRREFHYPPARLERTARDVALAATNAIGIVIEQLLLRPFYRRAEEYQLLVTFGLIHILEDMMRLIWGGTPLSADTLMDALPIIRIDGLFYPAYNLVVIGIGVVAALALWAVIYHTRFGVMLRATSQNRRMELVPEAAVSTACSPAAGRAASNSPKSSGFCAGRSGPGHAAHGHCRGPSALDPRYLLFYGDPSCA